MSDTAILEQTKGRADHLKPHWWGPGQSGNPMGRPKGSRSKLSDEFVDALYEDFKEHGPEAIVATRLSKPEIYVQVIAKLLPRDIKIEVPQLQKIAHVIVDVTNDKPIELQEVTDTLTPDQPQPIETQSVTDQSQSNEGPGGTHEVDRV